MWLPSKVYEALPWAYVAIGILFVTGVWYMDQRDFGSGFYFAFGVVSISAGLIVHYVRSQLRGRCESRPAAANDSNAADVVDSAAG